MGRKQFFDIERNNRCCVHEKRTSTLLYVSFCNIFDIICHEISAGLPCGKGVWRLLRPLFFLSSVNSFRLPISPHSLTLPTILRFLRVDREQKTSRWVLARDTNNKNISIRELPTQKKDYGHILFLFLFAAWKRKGRQDIEGFCYKISIIFKCIKCANTPIVLRQKERVRWQRKPSAEPHILCTQYF